MVRQVGDVLTRQRRGLVGVASALVGLITQVGLSAVGAGDVPAAPALGEGAGLVGAERAGGEDRLPGPVGVHGADEVAGQAVVVRGAVTHQAALGLPGEDGPVVLLL